jgi:predicted alpha/beta superfamily hydrolase
MSVKMAKNLYFISIAIMGVAFGCTSKLKEPLPEVATGKIERIAHFKSAHVDSRHIDVWLPDGYQGGEKHSVLYMHDGQMLFDASTTWNQQEWGVDEVVGRLIDLDVIDPCIVVGIWNSDQGRHSEYFPQKPFQDLPEWFRDSLLQNAKRNEERALFSKPVRSDRYLKFLVEELKPFIDARYDTKTGMEHTFIAGSSMGGLISMYAICEYPDVFGGAACLSTHWIGTFTKANNPIPGTFMNYIEQHIPEPSRHTLYFDYGTETLDSLYEAYQIQVDTILRKKGYTPANWKTIKFEGHDHSEDSWRRRLDAPITFLLKKKTL